MAFLIFMKNPSEQLPKKKYFRFKKGERLCSKKMIEKLFAEGNSLLVYPFKIVYLNIDFPDEYPAKTAFAVSKKLYKKAVQRNLVKRRMREAYRLNKHMLNTDGTVAKKAIVFIYIAKEILHYNSMEKAMVRALVLLMKEPAQNP